MPDDVQSVAKSASRDLNESRLESRKLDSMKELAYGASHEINNPLANIAARAQTLLRDEEDHQRRHALLAIHKQALRAHEMISDLMLFARPPELIRKKLDLKHLIDQVTTELAEACKLHDVQIFADIPKESVEIEADAEQLAVALSALCTNSLEAIGSSGTIWIKLQQQCTTSSFLTDDDQAGFRGQTVIEVVDDGPGLSEQACRHLFDPFYSGREAGRGLGFGLSKCWRIITDHGGTVSVDHCLNDDTDGYLYDGISKQGTRFIITLPIDFQPPSGEQPENVS